MDSTIAVALIGAAATVVGATIAGVVAWRNGIQKGGAGVPPSKDKELEQYAFTLDRLELETIIDDTGAGQNERRWIGVRVTQSIVNLSIPFRLRLNSPGAKISPPEIDALPDSPLPVGFVASGGSSDDVVQGAIVLMGSVDPDTPHVGFRVVQRFEKAFCLTRKEAELAYQNDTIKQEYASAAVVCPTKTILVSVRFPPAFKGKSFNVGAIVFDGPQERVNQPATQRLSGAVYRDLDNNRAALQVQSPEPGFRYAIWWWPPA